MGQTTQPKGVRLGGRKKGTVNKITASMRELMANFCEETMEEFFTSFHAIDEPKDKCKIWLEMQSYVTPKPSSVELNVTSGAKTFMDDMLALTNEKK